MPQPWGIKFSQAYQYELFIKLYPFLMTKYTDDDTPKIRMHFIAHHHSDDAYHLYSVEIFEMEHSFT